MVLEVGKQICRNSRCLGHIFPETLLLPTFSALSTYIVLETLLFPTFSTFRLMGNHERAHLSKLPRTREVFLQVGRHSG